MEHKLDKLKITDRKVNKAVSREHIQTIKLEQAKENYLIFSKTKCPKTFFGSSKKKREVC